MKLVYFSDTHNRHEELELPKGDILIFGGDMSKQGTPKEVLSFLKWFNKQTHQYKILIAGNHDICLDPSKGAIDEEVANYMAFYTQYYAINHYLNNSDCEIEGIRFWGSPYSPGHDKYGWAFQRKRNELGEIWEHIDNEPHIIITHCPPYKKRDVNLETYENVGCEHLMHKVQDLSPDLHLFGHIHESYGLEFTSKTAFVNGSICSPFGELNKPFVIDYDPNMWGYNYKKMKIYI